MCTVAYHPIRFVIFFFFFSAKILSGPYLWNRYSQRLQTECAAWSCGLILHCCLPSNSLRYFFFFFSAMILSGPYFWNCYSQRLQIECAAWSCGLILHCCLPSNSLHYFFFNFFSATILSGPYLWHRYSQRLQIECAAWSCSLILHCCLPSNSLRYFFFSATILFGVVFHLRGIAPRSHTGRPRTCLVNIYSHEVRRGNPDHHISGSHSCDDGRTEYIKFSNAGPITKGDTLEKPVI